MQHRTKMTEADVPMCHFHTTLAHWISKT